MKTLNTTNETCHERNTLCVRLPFEAMVYLSKEYNLTKQKRFSKLDAFNDLVYRGSSTANHPSSDTDEEVGANISVLAKAWTWSRSTTSKFVTDLQKMNVVDIITHRSGFFVSVKPEVFQWVNYPQKEPCDSGEASLQPQTASSQSSSSERKETFLGDKKIFEK